MPEDLAPGNFQLQPLPKLPPINNSAPPLPDSQWSSGYFRSLIYRAATGKVSGRQEEQIVQDQKKTFPGTPEDTIRKNVHQSVEDINSSIGLSRVVTIILGLLLIAAGIFSFKNVHEPTINAVVETFKESRKEKKKAKKKAAKEAEKSKGK